MNNIKAARKAAGMSQKFVAMTLGVKGPSVSNWESGKTMPTPENLRALAQLFGVTVDYLIGREDQAQNEAEAIVEHYIMAQGGRPAGAIAFTPNPIIDARERIRRDSDRFSPDTMKIIEGILDKLTQLDEEGQKEVVSFVDFKISQKNGDD